MFVLVKSQRIKEKWEVMPVLEKVEVMARLDKGNEHCYCQMLL